MKKAVNIIAVISDLLIEFWVAGTVILKSVYIFQDKGLILKKVKVATILNFKKYSDFILESFLTSHVTINGFPFSIAAWGSYPEMIAVKRLTAGVSLFLLLSSQVQVRHVAIEGVALRSNKANLATAA